MCVCAGSLSSKQKLSHTISFFLSLGFLFCFFFFGSLVSNFLIWTNVFCRCNWSQCTCWFSSTGRFKVVIGLLIWNSFSLLVAGMSAPLTPSKRSRDRSFVKSNGKGKWQKSSGSRSQNQSLKLSPGYAVFRVLFPVSRIGSLVGKDGDALSKIREETGVEIRVEDAVPGCDERIVIIGGSNQETEVSTEQKGKEDNKNSEVEENDDDIAKSKKKEDKDSPPVEDAKQKEVSHLRKALFLVSEKIFDEEPEADGTSVEGDKTFVLRLLVLSSQVGCLLGKGGSVVKQMSSDSGAQIRILPRDKLPPLATTNNELVQVILESTIIVCITIVKFINW